MAATSRLILAIDTAGSVCSVALARGGTLLAAERRAMRHGHGEALLPMIDAIASRAAVSAGALDWVAVSVGPGGFTGIRVGLAAARGIALAADAELIGITSFAAVAAAVTPQSDAALLVALDSRRAELYVQLFRPDGSIAAPEAVAPEQLERHVAALVGGRWLLVAGDAAAIAGAALTSRPRVDIAPDSAPDALGVLAAAQQLSRSGRPPDPAAPLYLRPPDVSMPKTGRGR